MPTRFTHQVTLHFRSLSLTNVPFANLLANAERVYAQYGIRIRFGSGQSLHLSEEEARRYQQVDGQCRWAITAGEYAEVQKLGPPTPGQGVRVYFVNRFAGRGSLGCGGHAPGKPACICAAAGSKWTMAHEVGHVLLGSSFSPVHSTDRNNLMYSSTPAITADLPVLTDAQVERIKQSPYCVRC